MIIVMIFIMKMKHVMINTIVIRIIMTMIIVTKIAIIMTMMQIMINVLI